MLLLLSTFKVNEIFKPPAPSAPPTSVSVSAVTSSSITVQWGAVDCIHRNGDITGYSVRYGEVGSGSTQTVSISGVSVTEATISSLMPSMTYSIRMAAENSAGTGDFSNITFHLTLGITFCCKHAVDITFVVSIYIVVVGPVLSADSTTNTSISLSWTSAGSVMVSYEVMWQRDTSGECPDEDEDSISLTGGSTSYDIMGLEEDSSYSITVTASNVAGSSAVSNTVTAMTLESGKRLLYI